MDEYVFKIGELMLRCEDVVEEDWDLLSIVYDTGEGFISNSGFLYIGDRVIPIISEIEEEPLLLDNTIEEFREKVFESSGRKFKQLLIQMEKKSERIKIEFEFDNAQRWTFAPSKLNEVKESLRPHFD